MSKLFGTLPLALVGLVGCTIVSNPRQPENPPPAPPPAQAQPAPAQPPQAQPPAQEPATPPKVGWGGPRKRPPGAEPPPPLAEMTGTNTFGRAKPFEGSLEGHVYWLDEGTRKLPDLSTLTPVTKLYSLNLQVSPRDFRQGFPGVAGDRFDWFAIRYEGDFQVAQAGQYKFRVVSDDGSKVYIDNGLLIDNDGIHGPRSKDGTINLAAGTHKLRVDYFQGHKWSVALQLWVTGPDGAEKFWTPSF